MKSKCRRFKGLTVIACSMLTALGAQAFDGRIAVTADGNVHDSDDFGATAATLVMLAKAGLQEQLVHYDYSSHIGTHSSETTADGELEMEKSSLEGQERFNFNRSVFFDDTKELQKSIDNIAKVVNESSSENRLYFILAGPTEVLYRGLKAADADKLQYVTVVSHSWWNNNHYDDVHGGQPDHDGPHTELHSNIDDIKDLGVTYDEIANQNDYFNTQNTGGWTSLEWMENHQDDDIRWMYDRIRAVGRPDFSDSGMAWYLITGDEKGSVEDFEDFIGDGIDVAENPENDDETTDPEDDNGTIETTVSFSNLPTSMASSTTIPVAIDYAVAEELDIVIALNSPDGTWLGGTRKTVTTGTGTVNLEVNLSDKPAAGSDYKLACSVRPVGGDWTTNIASQNELITFTDESTPEEPSTPETGATFEEKDGLIVIEAENATLPSSWAEKTDMSGYTGSSYIEYTGGNSMGSANESSAFTYEVKINNPGTYQFKWHSRNGAGAEAADAENDTWLKIDADDFYGMSGSTKIDCKDEYMKVWIQSMDSWSWDMKGEHGTNGLSIHATFDKAGVYTINLAGRSKGHVIDRIVMYKSDVSNPTNLDLAETLADTTTPPAEEPPAEEAPAEDPPVEEPPAEEPPAEEPPAEDPSVEQEATLTPTMDAYLQGTKTFNTTDLRVEAGNRTSYLKFDLSSIEGKIESMELAMTVGTDAGNGTIIVSQGNSTDWDESNLSSTNAPSASSILAESTGSLPLGGIIRYDISTADTSTNELSLILTMENGGNDVSFASKESNATPELIVKYSTGESESLPALMPAFGSSIALKANSNGYYVCADQTIDPTDAGAVANKTTAGLWETFIFVDAGSDYIALKAKESNLYFVADEDYDYLLKANSATITEEAKFKWIMNDDDTISLQAKVNGKYVCSDKYLDETIYPLAANRVAIGAWEKFTWEVK